jgi:hypothetical protein
VEGPHRHPRAQRRPSPSRGASFFASTAICSSSEAGTVLRMCFASFSASSERVGRCEVPVAASAAENAASSFGTVGSA